MKILILFCLSLLPLTTFALNIANISKGDILILTEEYSENRGLIGINHLNIGDMVMIAGVAEGGMGDSPTLFIIGDIQSAQSCQEQVTLKFSKVDLPFTKANADQINQFFCAN